VAASAGADDTTSSGLAPGVLRERDFLLDGVGGRLFPWTAAEAEAETEAEAEASVFEARLLTGRNGVLPSESILSVGFGMVSEKTTEAIWDFPLWIFRKQFFYSSFISNGRLLTPTAMGPSNYRTTSLLCSWHILC